jgi:hypothetical protein
MGLTKIICDFYHFYEESFQPHAVFEDNREGRSGFVIRFGPKISFGVPAQEIKDIEVWVHEFIEFCIQKLLIEYDAVGEISFLYEKDSKYFEWNHEVSHIIASSTGQSGLDGRTVDADTYWDEMMKKYSERRVSLPLPCSRFIKIGA